MCMCAQTAVVAKSGVRFGTNYVAYLPTGLGGIAMRNHQRDLRCVVVWEGWQGVNLFCLRDVTQA